MKKLFVAFLLLFCLVQPVFAESFDWYNSKHFVYPVPSGWKREMIDSFAVYRAESSANSVAGTLAVADMDISVDSAVIDDYSPILDAVIEIMFGDSLSNLYAEDIPHSSMPGRAYVFDGMQDGVPADIGCAVLISDTYVFWCSLVKNDIARNELVQTLKTIGQSVVFLPSPVTSVDTFATTPDITSALHAIGKDVYDERFRDAYLVDSSGYLFVDSDAGYARSQRIDMALLNAKEFLEQLRPYLDSGEISFKEINFRTYLECVDNYGNVEDVKVLSFWLKEDDVLQMKFETMPISGLRALSYDWYQHSVLK